MTHLPGLERFIKIRSEILNDQILLRQKLINEIIEEDVKKRIVLQRHEAQR